MSSHTGGRGAVWKVLQITQTTGASLPSLNPIAPAPGSAAHDRAPSWIFPNKRFRQEDPVRRFSYSLVQILLGNSGEASGQTALVETANVKTNPGLENHLCGM